MHYFAKTFETALENWIEARKSADCEASAKALYRDFDHYVKAEKLMRRGPGPTPFGEALLAAGFTKRVWRGLVFYKGLRPALPFVQPGKHGADPIMHNGANGAQNGEAL